MGILPRTKNALTIPTPKVDKTKSVRRVKLFLLDKKEVVEVLYKKGRKKTALENFDLNFEVVMKITVNC